jgi:hypothetical protein
MASHELRPTPQQERALHDAIEAHIVAFAGQEDEWHHDPQTLRHIMTPLFPHVPRTAGAHSEYYARILAGVLPRRVLAISPYHEARFY